MEEKRLIEIKSLKSILKRILAMIAIIIFSTILLIFFIVSLPYRPEKTMTVVFSVMLGSMVTACFVYLILRKYWVTIFIIVYLVLFEIALPMYCLFWAENSPSDSIINRVAKLIQSYLYIYCGIVALLLMFIISKIKYKILKKENIIS